jgi:hypothetical protein
MKCVDQLWRCNSSESFQEIQYPIETPSIATPLNRENNINGSKLFAQDQGSQ